MRSPYVSLRHDEARDRADLLRVTGYDVILDLAADERSVTSLSGIRLTTTGGTGFLGLRPLSLRAITLEGAALPRWRIPWTPRSGRWRPGPSPGCCTDWRCSAPPTGPSWTRRSPTTAADRLLAEDDLDPVVRRTLADVHRRLLAVPGA